MSESIGVVKMGAGIFTLETVCDNRIMESVSKASFDPQHPLLGDRQRLNKISDIMYAKIQKTLFPLRRRGRSMDEPILKGSGVSAEDVLSEALSAVLQYPPESLRGEWEALAVQIAHYKALDAYKASQKGLRATEHRGRLQLLSGDAEREDPGGETQEPLFGVLPGDWDGPDVVYEEVEKVLVFHDLAREDLDEREQKIVFAILNGLSRKEVGRELELTSQRVGQIFKDAMTRLVTSPNNPFTSEKYAKGEDP